MHAESLIAQGEDHLKNENWSEAIALFNKALEEGGKPSEVIPRRAWAYLKADQPEKAAEEFSLAIELDPQNPHLYSERGVSRLNQNMIPLALLDFDYALELDPENPYRYASRGYVKDRLGDLEGAHSDYLQAINLDPNDSITRNNLEILEDRMKYSRPRTIHPVGDGNISAPQTDIREPEKPELNDYIKEIGKVFTSREGFQSFIRFLTGKK